MINVNNSIPANETIQDLDGRMMNQSLTNHHSPIIATTNAKNFSIDWNIHDYSVRGYPAIKTESISKEHDPVTGDTPTKIVQLISIIGKSGIDYTFTMTAPNATFSEYAPTLDTYSIPLIQLLHNSLATDKQYL